jgi:hypothetical protein
MEGRAILMEDIRKGPKNEDNMATVSIDFWVFVCSIEGIFRQYNGATNVGI